MGKMSKEKGARFERELASLLRAEGFQDAERTAQHSGKNGGEPDVKGVPGIHIEAKHVERMQLYDWMEQAVRDCKDKGSGDLPAVFHRQNYKDVLVTMRFEDFMKIYREYASGLTM